MGTLEPTYGSACIITNNTPHPISKYDNAFFYVSHNAYFVNSTINSNIAFGVPRDQVDHDMVLFAANKACLKDDIEN